MSDADLRGLERKWRETGNVEDEAAWLLARVRVGDLAQSDLDLAACLGYTPACVAAPGQSRLRFTGDWLQLARQLQEWGLHITLRATAAAVRASQPVGRDLLAVEQVESWLCGLEPAPDPKESDPLSLHSGMPGYWLREVWKEDKLLSNGPDPLAGARAWALHAGSAIRYARVSETVAALAFRDELVPWALGDSDPVRERVEARRREVVRTRTAD